MAAYTTTNTLLTIPIYVQLPLTNTIPHNRHVLITLRLFESTPDMLRLEVAWNVFNASLSAPAGPGRISVPNRRGVQVFLPPSPMSGPIYTIISRFNDVGETYHLSVAINIREAAGERVRVNADFTRIQGRNLIRSEEFSARNLDNEVQEQGDAGQ
ncbi:hypothetical protein FKP32DRAFT_1672609 [Trametes sanguinea]|nr:hypothetical protein FKP32DRAFT_1672609 [Trametes sanguinea]